MENIKKVICNFKDIVKFIVSSISSFLIDYSFFAIFSLFIGSISMCNIMARIISATCNYMMNRKFVFRSKNSLYKSILSYIILALIILTLNTQLLNILVYKLTINKFIAKIIVEIILFIFSFTIQQKIVFKKNSKETSNI